MTTLAIEDSIYLRGERGVSVVMMHHSGGWHGHIGDGDNYVRVTLVVPSSAVGHIVDPLPVVLQMSLSARTRTFENPVCQQ